MRDSARKVRRDSGARRCLSSWTGWVVQSLPGEMVVGWRRDRGSVQARRHQRADGLNARGQRRERLFVSESARCYRSRVTSLCCCFHASLRCRARWSGVHAWARRCTKWYRATW